MDEKTKRPMRGERSNESHQTSLLCVEDDEDPKTMQLLEDWDGISGSQTAMIINLLAFVPCIMIT